MRKVIRYVNHRGTLGDDHVLKYIIELPSTIAELQQVYDDRFIVETVNREAEKNIRQSKRWELKKNVAELEGEKP